jgi:hypothetical protein
MAIVLGLNLGHDGAAAVVKNGRLVSAISRERLTRKKKDTGVGKAEIDYVLDIAGCKLTDIDVIAFTTYNYAPDNYVKIIKLTGEEVRQNLWDHPPRVMTLDFRASIGGKQQSAIFVQHHLTHCASAFYTSNFERAACFSMDASAHRPEACSLFGYGMGTELHALYCPGLMIGNTYSLLTEKLGLGDGLFKSGTTMGLAAYGKPLPMAVENWEHYGESFYERRFQPDDDRFIELMWSELSGLPPTVGFSKQESDSQRAMDIAASLQYVFEETIIKAANELHRKTASYADGNLCLSGGSFYNCNANSAILKRTPFERVGLFPACGDDGTAVGAALFVAHTFMDEKRVHYEPEEIVFLGRSLADVLDESPANLLAFLGTAKLKIEFLGFFDANRPAVNERRNPVPNRVLHERLKNQGRHGHLRRVTRDLRVDRQPAPEADLFHVQVLPRQGDLPAERDPRRSSEAQAVAQEITEPLAHLARLVRIRSDQPGHRVETVEEKVRIDLCTKRPELRVSLGDLRLQRAPARGHRLFERLHRVVRGDRHQIRQGAEPDQQDEELRLAGDGHFETKTSERFPPELADHRPQRRREVGGGQRGHREPECPGASQRNGAADVTGRQRNRRRDDAQRNREQERGHQRGFEQRLHQEAEQDPDQQPRQQVQA